LALELYHISERIKHLREQQGMTQADLARRLQLSRSSVNGWEMGLFLPSTAVVVELSKVFHVTTDYLLGLEQNASLRTDNLNEKEVATIATLIHLLQCRISDNMKEGSTDI